MPVGPWNSCTLLKSQPVLEVRDLRVTRGADTILYGISWRVERGEHWVILGANGSGKTSLLSVLTAYLTPSSGSVTVLGAVYGRTDWRELRKLVGLVSSSIRQMIGDDATALEIVVSGQDATLNFRGRIKPADRQHAHTILRQVECEKLAARPWAVLSQGERQRVLIGRAIMAQPRLLILDEPCAGLDPLARENFVRFLNRLGRRRNAPSLVLVTHHVEEIVPVFTHALLLREGRVLASGSMRFVLTSSRLSETFGTRVRLQRDSRGGHRLAVSHEGHRTL